MPQAMCQTAEGFHNLHKHVCNLIFQLEYQALTHIPNMQCMLLTPYIAALIASLATESTFGVLLCSLLCNKPSAPLSTENNHRLRTVQHILSSTRVIQTCKLPWDRTMGNTFFCIACLTGTVSSPGVTAKSRLA